MANNNAGIIIVMILLAVGGYFYFSGDLDFGGNDNIISGETQSTTGQLKRTVPIEGNGEFDVKYSTDRTGTFGIIIEDTVSSGCTFSNGKNVYKSVLLSTSSNSQTVKVTGTNCKFNGNYNFVTGQGAEDTQLIGEQTVQ